MVPLFEALHQQNNFVSKSFMRKKIVFSQAFDPFFLKHSELLRKTNSKRLKMLKTI